MDKKERWFRVKYGYHSSEYISIPEDYLAKAIYAKQKGSLFSFNDKVVDGKEIKTFTPDYHKHTGWNSWYEPKDPEDFKQIERDCPDYTGSIDQATTTAILAIKNGDISLLDRRLTPRLK